MIVWFPDSAQLTHPTHACGNSIHIFVFVSSVLLRLSLATSSRDYSSRATRLGFPVVCLCRASEHDTNHLGTFKIAVVYDNHTYQLKDVQGNTKKFCHDCLRPCCAILTQRLFVWAFPDLLQTLILVSDNKQGARGGCCNQEALNESPLDVSNNMNQPDGNVKWRAFPPN
ncbi:hypothetical protein DSO57_1020735 [Entomophthora muscae]|uniref:Uncharacterized protein n=1 Tax=Entomophthora muscae TaxID=34485 RepID=A0ACC2UQP9_9FUNG|nr:hypothetical protein DSO57_1020735 [Entomophthora muscae]